MFTLPVGRPALMGVLNVTPDSFSDGGQFLAVESAIARGLAMVEEGADLVDVGGESTRPGSEGVSAQEEAARVVSVVKALSRAGVPVSIDTSKAVVARQALDAGAVVVNDVTALEDEQMVRACSDAKCTVCLMHMQGKPRTMQAAPQYGDVVAEVREFLLARASAVMETGIPRDRVWIDPGIGFGKTLEHNLLLLRRLSVLVDTGYPVLVGVSRKSFIGRLLGDAPVGQRLEGTLAVQVLAQAQGARIIRAHDVREAKRAMTVAQAVLG